MHHRVVLTTSFAKGGEMRFGVEEHAAYSWHRTGRDFIAITSTMITRDHDVCCKMLIDTARTHGYYCGYYPLSWSFFTQKLTILSQRSDPE